LEEFLAKCDDVLIQMDAEPGYNDKEALFVNEIKEHHRMKEQYRIDHLATPGGPQKMFEYLYIGPRATLRRVTDTTRMGSREGE